MEILPPPEVSTEHWTAKVEQYELPNYRDLPPDAFKARGKTWSQDPAGRPWFDRDGAAEKIDDLVGRGLISADEEKLLRLTTSTNVSAAVIASAISRHHSAVGGIPLRSTHVSRSRAAKISHSSCTNGLSLRE